ncbi:hypothetical protein HUK65_09745 [Rhodobacteraceae bacterium 2376]|uniref:Uncharacterized protein n=1 Tax=Rhabdonatronobacter sediminivivens TaxID=2743469 RepID=A0A7Z0I0H5_9RHOB|nr:hypothetical protein [Rhabdonatronobacter sediminivivens]NYS25274.1 hypothetical protein [Rhabdonatronobacter sediminivivens]
MKTRSPLRLFLVYLATFAVALVAAWIILLQLTGGVQDGQWILLLLPPLGGMAVFHGLFPLISRIRLGLEFLAVGGALVYGLGALLAGAVWLGLLTPTAAILFWLVGIFGPGWWILSGWAERIGYFE